jgi:hypothetical protein
MSTEPELTEAERAVAELLHSNYGSEYEASHLSVDGFAGEAREIVAKLRPLLAAEFRKAAGDALADLAPQQATPDARDAFWRAAVITRSKASTAAALRTTTPEDTK